MKKLLPLLLLPLAANAFEPSPGYSKIIKSEAGVTYYMQKVKIKAKGSLRYFWVESDDAQFSSKEGFSPWGRAYNVINCKTEELRQIQFTRFGVNNKALITKKLNDGDWEPIAPGTIAEVFYDIVCKRK